MPTVTVEYSDSEIEAMNNEGDLRGCARCPSCKGSKFWKTFHHTVYESGMVAVGKSRDGKENVINGHKSLAVLCEECWSKMTPEERVESCRSFLDQRKAPVRSIVRMAGNDGVLCEDPSDVKRYEREIGMINAECDMILSAVANDR